MRRRALCGDQRARSIADAYKTSQASTLGEERGASPIIYPGVQPLCTIFQMWSNKTFVTVSFDLYKSAFYHSKYLVHGQVTIIFVVSAGLSVCLFVRAEFFSAVFDAISIKLGHMLYVWI